ncbi:MAG: hypothetical protein ACD_18C00347G0005 [uncultured bacterium]|nr:MAG: hypothetical protein ACD_18C00347G0005 [uncultured bacterium]OGH90458.1 MAG: hypothetical protein A2507_03590 [Candidatus Magasanikbacteria bacterium RIFOXYD12_FULL_33_17]HAO52445.1 MFS transporter [Candidatus Magasanikbacteria bacterium]
MRITMLKNNKRWIIGTLMFLGIVINYMDRVNISHAILQIKAEFHLSSLQQGIILSSFSWGYVAFMLFGGYLVDKKGSRIMGALSCFLWSIFTGLGALAGNFKVLLGSRVLLGMGEAPIFPSNAKVVKQWFPLKERGRATALFDSGSYIGSAIAAPFIIYLMVTFGWRYSFAIFSILGIIWSIVWFSYYRDPEEFKSLSNEEKAILPIQKNKEPDVKVKNQILTLLKNRKIIGISIGFFCYNYLKSFFLTWFPTYLVMEKGFSLIKVGFVAMIPPLVAILGELYVGYLTDKMISKNINVSFARKIPLCLGMLISSVIIFSVFAESIWMAMLLLTISYTALISASPGIWAIPGDLSRTKNMVGTIGGIQNTFSNMAGIIAPIMTGFLLDRTGSFVVPIILSGVIAILGAISYWFIVGKLEPVV